MRLYQRNKDFQNYLHLTPNPLYTLLGFQLIPFLCTSILKMILQPIVIIYSIILNFIHSIESHSIHRDFFKCAEDTA